MAQTATAGVTTLNDSSDVVLRATKTVGLLSSALLELCWNALDALLEDDAHRDGNSAHVPVTLLEESVPPAEEDDDTQSEGNSAHVPVTLLEESALLDPTPLDAEDVLDDIVEDDVSELVEAVEETELPAGQLPAPAASWEISGDVRTRL